MTELKQEMGLDILDFRRTAGLFATGITVVAVQIDGVIRGMTANAVASLSLDPPLMLVAVQKDAHWLEYLRKSSGFSINILNERQADLSRFFANMWPESEPAPSFTFLPWTGGPRLEGAVGAIACLTYEFIEGGDHWIVLGRVVDLYRPEQPEPPLLFFGGQYRWLTPVDGKR